MDLFTYLMSKKGYNYLPHKDLFSYLLGKNNSNYKIARGTDININSIKGKLYELLLTKESTQNTSILPTGYTQVDYIQSSGTQYIDTELVGNVPLEFSGEFIPTDLSAYNYLVGSRDGDYRLFGLGIRDTKVPFYVINNSFNDANMSLTENTKYSFKTYLSNGLQRLYINDIIVKGTTFTTTSTNTKNIYLFTLNMNGTPSEQCFIGKLYNFKIKENDVLTRDFIPCYRNSDNEVGLYDLVNNVFYTNQGTGVFTYGNVVSIPNPDYPEEVKTVKGYRNLFDKDAILENYYYDANGDRTQGGSGYTYNNFEYVPAKRKIALSYSQRIGDSSIRVCEYNSTTFIKRTVINSNNQIITLDNNTNKIIFSIDQRNDSYFDNLLITNEETILPYVSYGNNWIYTTITGKNLFDKNKANLTVGYINNSGDFIEGGTSSATKGFIPIYPNTDMVLSGSDFTVYAFYDKDKNFIEKIIQASSTYSFNKNAYYMRIQGYTSSLDVDTIQLELGTTPTTYEAYKENIITLPLNDNEICGIGDDKDEYIVDKNGHCYLNKKANIVILNGSEDITLNNEGQDYQHYKIIITKKAYVDNNEVLPNLSTHFISTKNNWAYYENGKFTISSSGDLIICSTTINSIANMQQWLSQNKPEFVYKLANEDLIDLNYTVDMKIFKGTNNITNSEDAYMIIKYL